ncbi:TetR/AcrR family transcriptional regulator [Pseudoruegeria sp. HB172150]|uniref:TetR/AcrR family transcriptional regulator n=1 Tax=Pseudoruegeria sp. HB172150 TaxID=2721164 RepID=UPI0015558F4E|nr:TetR/AcrR family transcriptional regulator [Pseudoruegeria sp. HB172150]
MIFCRKKSRDPGQARREKTRLKLIEAATLVLSERDPEDTLIDHVIRRAGVSRGTFYNYFRSVEELMQACKEELARELVALILEAQIEESDPARKLILGLKQALELTRRCPRLTEFSARLGFRAVGPGSFVHEIGGTVISEGMSNGVFRPMPAELAVDMIEASMIAAARRTAAGEPVEPEVLVAAVGRMLGVPAELADRIAALPVPAIDIPPDSLLARSNRELSGRQVTS